VALFVQRVRAQRSAFALTAENAPAVAAICTRLDGLPLALELAAAASKLLPPVALLARLDHHLQVLVDGARDLPERQRTLRDTLAWSYDLLDADVQALFCRLAAFAGGCTLDAAEAVGVVGATGTSPPLAGGALGGLGALVDQSLLRLAEPEDGEPRLTMLETIRAYGLERLAARGDEAAVRRRHAAYYLALAEAAEPALLGPDQMDWLARLERERDNLRTALRWAQENGVTEFGLRLAGALWRFWHLHGYMSEGRRWLDDLLARDGADGSPAARAVRAKALRGAGGVAFYQGDYARAGALYDDYRLLCAAMGDEEGCAGALTNLAIVAAAGGEDARAWTLNEECLTLARGLKNGESVIAAALNNLGDLACRRGDYARARGLLEESLALYRRRGHTWGIAVVLANLATLVRAQGDEEQALVRYREGLALCGAVSQSVVVARCLEGIAGVAATRGQPERAARLAGAAASLRQLNGMPLEHHERADYDRTMATAHAALGDDAFTALWIQGRALSPEQAVAVAWAD